MLTEPLERKQVTEKIHKTNYCGSNASQLNNNIPKVDIMLIKIRNDRVTALTKTFCKFSLSYKKLEQLSFFHFNSYIRSLKCCGYLKEAFS